MQVTETKSDGLKREYRIVVSAKDIEERLRNRLEEIGQSVSWPGFRPGKVPLSLIRKRYAPSVMGEVLENAVTESSEKAISEGGLRPAMQPKIEVASFDEGKDLEFTMAMEVLPEIEPIDFSKLTVERLTAEVTDDEVDELLANLAERHRRFAPVAEVRESRKGDVVVIDFVGKIGDEAFAGGAAENYELELGSSRFIPGFEDQLECHKAGEKVVVQVTFPAAYGNAELAGKEARFDVDIKEIREPVSVAVDDALATELGLENLESLKTSLREQIEREHAALSRAHLKRALLDELAAAHDFVLPEGVVEAEFESVWAQINAEKARTERGEADASGEAEDNEESEEDLRRECRALAERRVRLGLLLGEVGRRNNIEVSPEELGQAVRAEAARHPGQERQIVEHFQKSPETLASLRAPIFEDKVVDFVLEMAQVRERKVSPEELYAGPDEAEAAAGGGSAKKKSSKAKAKKTGTRKKAGTTKEK